MKLFDGNSYAKVLEEQIRSYLSKNRVGSVLAIVQIGENESSSKYVNLKQKFCEKYKIPIKVFKIDENLPDKEIVKIVRSVFNDKKVSGGIIQLPLPRESIKSVLNLIPENKDIDMLSSKSLDRFYSGDFSKLSPVVRAFDYFINENNIEIQGAKAIVVGNGFLVGKPISFYLFKHGAKVAVLDDYKKGQKLNCHLLIMSAGIPNMINGENVSSGCNVVDYGSSIVEGRTVGDINLGSKLDHLGVVSPSPGGIGPLVVRFLIMNFLGIRKSPEFA